MPVFTNRAFESWPLIVAGGILFGTLFMLVVMMTDLVFQGTFRPTYGATALGLAALVGYVGLALMLRRDEDRTPRW